MEYSVIDILIRSLTDTLSNFAVEPSHLIGYARPSFSPWPILLIIIAIRIVTGAWGYHVGKKKGMGGLGLFLGAFLGVIGILILSAVPSRIQTTTCKYCKKIIPADSHFCPVCGVSRDENPDKT